MLWQFSFIFLSLFERYAVWHVCVWVLVCDCVFASHCFVRLLFYSLRIIFYFLRFIASCTAWACAVHVSLIGFGRCRYYCRRCFDVVVAWQWFYWCRWHCILHFSEVFCCTFFWWRIHRICDILYGLFLRYIPGRWQPSHTHLHTHTPNETHRLPCSSCFSISSTPHHFLRFYILLFIMHSGWINVEIDIPRTRMTHEERQIMLLVDENISATNRICFLFRISESIKHKYTLFLKIICATRERIREREWERY